MDAERAIGEVLELDKGDCDGAVDFAAADGNAWSPPTTVRGFSISSAPSPAAWPTPGALPSDAAALDPATPAGPPGAGRHLRGGRLPRLPRWRPMERPRTTTWRPARCWWVGATADRYSGNPAHRRQADDREPRRPIRTEPAAKGYAAARCLQGPRPASRPGGGPHLGGPHRCRRSRLRPRRAGQRKFVGVQRTLDVLLQGRRGDGPLTSRRCSSGAPASASPGRGRGPARDRAARTGRGLWVPVPRRGALLFLDLSGSRATV